jgi:lipase chaperone LimK
MASTRTYEQKKAALQSQLARLENDERKKRTRRLIQVGAIVGEEVGSRLQEMSPLFQERFRLLALEICKKLEVQQVNQPAPSSSES